MVLPEDPFLLLRISFPGRHIFIQLVPGAREHLLEEGERHRPEYGHLDEDVFHLFSIFTLRLGAAKQPDHAPQQSLVLDDGYPPAVEMSVDVRETPNVKNKFARFVQGGWGGWPTGNGKKVSNGQACCPAQLCPAAA